MCRRSDSGIAPRNRDRHCATGLRCAVRDRRRLIEAELRNRLVAADGSSIRNVA